MQPHKRSLFDLFDSKKRYVVPLFQRQYVWTKEAQWEPLWEDIQRKYFEKLRHGDGPPHFLGAMVIEQKKIFGNEVPAHRVVDGQQRLTTFQIFLSAFRDVCEDLGEHEFAEECQTHLLNRGVMSDPDEERYKVWPTNLDRPQFKDVIDSKSRVELEKRHPLIREKYARKPKLRPLMIECYLFFHATLTDLLKNENTEFTPHIKVQKLFEALRASLQVVTIELEGNDDPQVIFETLNARGEPLLPSDLLRNFIFYRAAQKHESQEELYNTFWLAFDDAFWRKEEKQGRLTRPRSDIFLQHYLALKRCEEINIGHLFAEYKFWINTKHPFASVRDELAEMDKHRGYFKRLVEPEEGTRFGAFARALQVFDIRTIYPLILDLLSRQLPGELLDAILTDLESYVVRRAVCGLTTKNYNRLFLGLLSRLPDSNLSREAFRKVLMEQQGDSTVWPRDEQFEKGWLENSVFESLSPARVQWMLRRLEEHLRLSKAEVVEMKSPLTIEHILPQEWIANWPLPNGKTGVRWFERWNAVEAKEEIEASNIRDRIKHTLGNLTLLTQPLNTAVSNETFEAKRPEILNNSALALNRYFQDVTVWNEDAIRARGQKLFEIARQVWPYGS